MHVSDDFDKLGEALKQFGCEARIAFIPASEIVPHDDFVMTLTDRDGRQIFGRGLTAKDAAYQAIVRVEDAQKLAA